MMVPGLEKGGLVKQCLEYNVTHDVGISIFHSMCSIPTATVRDTNLIALDNLRRVKKREDVGFHGQAQRRVY